MQYFTWVVFYEKCATTEQQKKNEGMISINT